MNLMNYLTFGIVLTLYLNREQPSINKEIEIDDYQQKTSISERLFAFIKFDDEESDEEI